ncbi:hypothetical protein ACIXC0_05700 [Bacteroides fragilis]|nr:hypothetical protein [Bacteroides fragilis]
MANRQLTSTPASRSASIRSRAPLGSPVGGIMTGHRRIDGVQIRTLADDSARSGKFLVRDGEFRAASGAQDFCLLFLSAHCEFVNS